MYYNSNTTPAPPQQHEKTSPNIDYTNLYIKNLDLTVDSPDLFRHFYDCGRIISARVMKNSQTKQSKGFGFVSFSKVEEASRALKEKNNTYIKSKQIIVAFHEPKKPRSKNNTNLNGNTNNGSSNLEKSNSNMNGHSLSSPSTLQTTYPPQYRSHDLLRRYSQPGIPSHPPPPYMPVAPAVTEYVPYSAAQQQPLSQPEYHHQRLSSNNDSTRKLNTNTNVNKPYRPPMVLQSQQQQQHQQQAPPPPSLTTLASGAYINIPPPAAATTPVPQQQPLPPTAVATATTTTTTTTNNNAITTSGIKRIGPIVTQAATGATPRPTLRRRGSTESVSSVMTETSTNVQKQRLAKAVVKCGEKEHVDDIVDMLLTLKRKERSICLFNSDYLKEKIALAKTALETFQEEEEEDEEKNNDDKAMVSRNPPIATTPSPPLATMNNNNNNATTRTPTADTRPKSRAIPIVAPASSSTTTKPATTTTPSPGPTRAEIDQFLASIENLTSHEKKQKLGDRLFPCVKVCT